MSPKESKNNIDLIIPVYNEAGVVEHTYGKVCDVIRQLPHIFHIYLVDDGSTDATADSLAALARIDPDQSRLVELRFFGGLTLEETAEVMNVSPATVSREWAAARAWLFRELARGNVAP